MTEAARILAQPRSAAARSAPELVGRREELRLLEDELDGAQEGSFRLVLLLGEAGVGKSRLGRELLARHLEVTGLMAQAYPLAASAAFGLWTEALDPFLQTLPDDEVVELCGGLLDDLASLFHRVALVRGSVPDRDPPFRGCCRAWPACSARFCGGLRSWSCSTTSILPTRLPGRQCATSRGISMTPGCW